MNALVLADTHIGPRRPGRRLPDRVYELLEEADAVLHAGDVTAPDLLAELEGFAPVHAVLGNNDVDLRLPERLELDLDGVRVAMVHDSGPTTGRAGRLRRWFPDADLVVFGHSHLPCHDVDPDGRHLLNPGSPTERRRADPHRRVARDRRRHAPTGQDPRRRLNAHRGRATTRLSTMRASTRRRS